MAEGQNQLSARAVRLWETTSPVVGDIVQAGEDVYHPTNNPQGNIMLTYAENKVCEDMMLKKLRSIQMTEDEEVASLYYGPLKGIYSFRSVLADFLNDHIQPLEKIVPEKLAVTQGVTLLLDSLAFILADRGDYFMVPTPVYQRVFHDLWDRAEVNMLEVPLSAENGYKPTVEMFESRYNEATEQGKRVKAILLLNPSNPLGDVYSVDFLKGIIQFAHKQGLHLISDEIYANSVFEPDTQFHSVLSLPLPDPLKVHFLWGVSKDLGLSGYRCAVVYSRHEGVIEHTVTHNFFNQSLVPLQITCQHLLRDKEWLDGEFFPSLRRGLRAQFVAARDRLADMGVPVLPVKAGIFLWADFSKFLSEQTAAAERALYKRFLAARVVLFPGTEFHAKEPGHFRLIFALKPQVFNEGLNRIESVLQSLPSVQTA